MVAGGLLCGIALIAVLVTARSRRRRTGQSGAEADWGLDSASDWQSPPRFSRRRSPRGSERPLSEREFRDWEQPKRPPRRQQERPEWGRPEPPEAYRPAAEPRPSEDPLTEAPPAHSASREHQSPSREHEYAPEREPVRERESRRDLVHDRQYSSGNGNGLRTGRMAAEPGFPGDRVAHGQSDAQHASLPKSQASYPPSPQLPPPRGLPLLPYTPPSLPQPDMSPGRSAENGRVMPGYPSGPLPSGPADRQPVVPVVPGSPPGPAAARPAAPQVGEVARTPPRYVPIPETDAGPQVQPADRPDSQPEPVRPRSWFEAIPRPQEPPVPPPDAPIGQPSPSGPVAGPPPDPSAWPTERPAHPAASPQPAAQPETSRPDSGPPPPYVTTGREATDDTCPLPVILPGQPAPASVDRDRAPARPTEPPPTPAAAPAPAPDMPSPAPPAAPAVRDSGLESAPDPGPHRAPGEYVDSATHPS
jgi:hypothetical protein